MIEISWVIIFTCTWIIPSIFLLGIFARTSNNYRASAILKSEPVVLLFLGIWFLGFNGPLLSQFATAMLFQIEVHFSGVFAPGEKIFFQIGFLAGAMMLAATLAKAFWTHVLLEDGVWGKVQDFQKPLMERGRLFGVIEFSIRCLIAVSIIFLQSVLNELQLVKHIDEIAKQSDLAASSLTQIEETEFVLSFSDWLIQFSLVGLGLFSLILIWLAIVYPLNIRRTDVSSEICNSSALGTLFSALPAFAIMYLMFVLSTGEFIPNFFVDYSPGNPPRLFVALSSFIFILLSMLIVFNLIITLIRGPWQEMLKSIGR